MFIFIYWKVKGVCSDKTTSNNRLSKSFQEGINEK